MAYWSDRSACHEVLLSPSSQATATDCSEAAQEKKSLCIHGQNINKTRKYVLLEGGTNEVVDDRDLREGVRG